MIKLRATEFLIAFTLIVGFFLLIINLSMHDNRNQITLQQSLYHFSEPNNLSIDLILKKTNQCHLTQLDPWDPQLIPYLYPDWNPWKTCTVSRQMHTVLQSSVIRMVNKTTSKCKYRCLYTYGEMDFTTDRWIEMKRNTGYYESCDFIETHCMQNKLTTFRYIHDQVIKPKGKIFQKEDNLHPGVFILVFDSTSSSSGIRTIMETNQVLRQLYDATTFYYHNKVGLNSRPNAFAMFSGTRISELDEYLFPGKSASEYPNSCKDGVKRNETVTYDFIDQNYASLIAEDWIGAFNWPNCKGYGDPPTDHYGGALILRSTGDKTKTDENDFDIHFYKGECHERYHKLMNFANKFLNEYSGISKFVMVWLSMLAHDTASGLYRTDKYFADFFRKNAKNLDNSFIFVMGDHGLRFGKIRATPPGQIEDNNPLLTVAVPKYLRSNEQLILNLKRNSRRHTSQFDFYATLYDIARYARKDNFEKWSKHDFRKEFGEIRGGIRAQSILRPISYDRTCEEMEIPKEYCICEQIWHKSDVHNDDATKAAQLIIDDINGFLKQKTLQTICEMLHFTEVISAEYLDDEQIFRIVVSASPSKGKYEARLLKKNDNFKIITKITRLDRYGNQGYCAPSEDVRPLCYCRQQLATITIKH